MLYNPQSLSMVSYQRISTTLTRLDIHNFDETGSAMGLTATTKVIARSEYYGRRSVLLLGYCECMTTIESINASVSALSSKIILKLSYTIVVSWTTF